MVIKGLKFVVAVTVAVLWFGIPTSAASDVVLKEKVTYYNVSGRNGREIFKNMLESGPKVGRRNDHALATTEYAYDVKNVDLVIERGRCVPKNLEVHVTVQYTYPRWNGSSSASNNTRRAWKTFSKSVVWHEKQHVKIAMDYAKDYAKALKKMRLRTSNKCSKAGFTSAWRATTAALRHNRRQRMFDRKDLRPGGRGYEAQLKLIKAE